MNRPLRRGACPGLSAPMPTGDGLLVRLLPIGTVSLSAFAKLCTAARMHGNGVIEITARGSVQVRGLSAISAPCFADAVAALGIAEDGVPILGSALAGLDPEEILDASVLAAELRRALAGTSLAARLAPKVSVVIDGGGALGLDSVSADIRLCAEAADGCAVRVGGDGALATDLGAVAAKDGVEAALRLLGVIARCGNQARARDVLAAHGSTLFRAAIADLLTAAEPGDRPREPGEAIGTHFLCGKTFARGVGLAFGHTEAATLEQLAEAASTAGAAGIRTAPDHTLLIIGLTQRTVRSFTAVAEELGFIVRADDPRRHVVACAGAPVCSSAHIAARAIAPRVAQIAAPYLGASFQIHISGCAKGCAHARSAALTIVGAPNGCGLVADGFARDAPFAAVAADELPAAIGRYARTREREIGHV